MIHIWYNIIWVKSSALRGCKYITETVEIHQILPTSSMAQQLNSWKSCSASFSPLVFSLPGSAGSLGRHGRHLTHLTLMATGVWKKNCLLQLFHLHQLESLWIPRRNFSWHLSLPECTLHDDQHHIAPLWDTRPPAHDLAAHLLPAKWHIMQIFGDLGLNGTFWEVGTYTLKYARSI